MKKQIIIQKKELGNIGSSLNYFLKFNIPKTAKILDIGCNYGSLIYNLYKLGYKNVQGIDVNKDTVSKGEKEYKEISKKINYYDGIKIPFKNDSFDVILMFDVIEHIPDVKNFLKKEIYRVLKKGGFFIFQTPNKIINIPWEIINKKSFTKWKSYHCSLQTKRSLKTILRNSGFQKNVVEKGNILTDHNKNKVKIKAGFFGIFLLYFLSIMPLSLNPNFWGGGRK
ncbi:MAG: class I SAM-dependent methyltransferase [Candidatus Pacearchaeota archaeon]